MRRDVMEAAGLEIFAEIAVVIFVITFLALVLRTLLRRKESMDEIAQIPLDDGTEVHS